MAIVRLENACVMMDGVVKVVSNGCVPIIVIQKLGKGDVISRLASANVALVFKDHHVVT